jgi:hypothetical protein
MVWGRAWAVRTCASFDLGDSGPDCPRNEVGDVGGGRGGEATAGALDKLERGRRDISLRGRGKLLSVLRGEGDDDGDGCGRANTPSKTNVGDADAARFDSLLKSRAGVGAFASVTGGAPEFVSLEENTAVLDEDARLVVLESEMLDPELGSLTI